MDIAERSISHHRKYFWFWVSLISAALLAAAYFMFSTGQTTPYLAFLGFCVLYFGIPAATSYRNWKFVEKNRETLVGIDAGPGFIVARK